MILPHGWSTARAHDYGISGVHLRHHCGWLSHHTIYPHDTYAARQIIGEHRCSDGYITEVVETTEVIDTYGTYGDPVVDIVEAVEEVVDYFTDDSGYDTGGYDGGGGFSSDW